MQLQWVAMQAPGCLLFKMVTCIFYGGVRNCMYVSIKKGLGVRLATEKNFPYYSTKYFRHQMPSFLDLFPTSNTAKMYWIISFGEMHLFSMWSPI